MLNCVHTSKNMFMRNTLSSDFTGLMKLSFRIRTSISKFAYSNNFMIDLTCNNCLWWCSSCSTDIIFRTKMQHQFKSIIQCHHLPPVGPRIEGRLSVRLLITVDGSHFHLGTDRLLGQGGLDRVSRAGWALPVADRFRVTGALDHEAHLVEQFFAERNLECDWGQGNMFVLAICFYCT